MPSIINDDAFYKKPLESDPVTKQTYFGKNLLALQQKKLAPLHQLEILQLDPGWPALKRPSWKRVGRLYHRRRGSLLRIRPQIFQLHFIRRLLRPHRPFHGVKCVAPEKGARLEKPGGHVCVTAATIENDIYGESRHRRAVDVV